MSKKNTTTTAPVTPLTVAGLRPYSIYNATKHQVLDTEIADHDAALALREGYARRDSSSIFVVRDARRVNATYAAQHAVTIAR